EYVLEDVLHAVSRMPWECEIVEEVDPPGWKVSLIEWRTVSQSRMSVAHDPDKMVALLRAIRFALTWTTPEQEKQHFEEQTQALLGIGADEFRRRWENKELSTDDPRIGHLLVVRPLGW